LEDYKHDVVIITGMSGAGKSLAADTFEDIGYYCIDNIPPVIIDSIVELGRRGQQNLSKIAFITDLRGGEMFDEINNTVERLKEKGLFVKLLFLDASDSELIRRYKENRRNHPLSAAHDISLSEAIIRERKKLSDIRTNADYVIDTTLLSSRQLRHQILDIFLHSDDKSMKIQCLSFGNKYGPVTEADLVFDVRCLPNPFYIEELRHLTGLDDRIKDYVMNDKKSQEFLERLLSLLNFSVPMYEAEGKSRLVIAVGCTGGRHRSVTIAEEIYKNLKSFGYHVSIRHRDIEK